MTNTMFTDVLIKLGLTEEQAEIYESLLTNGPQGAGELSKTTKVKRTYIYAVAKELIKKGLVLEETSGKKTLYKPQSPEALRAQAETQKTRAELALKELENSLPALSSQYLMHENKPIVTYYEGTDGIKKIFQDIYAAKEDIVWGCVDFEKADSAVPGHIVQHLIPLRITNKVFAKSFIARSEQAEQVQKRDKESLRESILLDKKDYPLPAEIDVYDDKIAMLSFEKGNFVGVLIQNQALATSLKSIFKLAFEKKS